MKCIYCKAKNTSVINSRPILNDLGVWRRRSCSRCSAVFTTKESANADNLFVIKRNKSRERFVYEKLFISVFKVVNTGKNRDNGSDAKTAKEITERVMEQLFMEAKEKNVSTQTIIRFVYKELRKRGKTFADIYIAYSDFRIKTALSFIRE